MDKLPLMVGVGCRRTPLALAPLLPPTRLDGSGTKPIAITISIIEETAKSNSIESRERATLLALALCCKNPL